MQMQTSGNSTVRSRMAELRMVCEREIPIQQHRIESLHTVHRDLFDSAKSEAQRTIELQHKLGKVKTELREAEDDLVKALAVKTRKEAKRMSLMESISDVKARAKELERTVEDQRKRKDEYASILSQQSEALTVSEKQCNQNREHREQIEDAISWYNRVLGFRIECGHGVKFIFTNINRENPNEEYSFVVRHENEIYTLLDCNPHLSDTKELVNTLNKSNGLFKFVRTMREKFQEAAAHGISLLSLSACPDSSIISLSAPEASISIDSTYDSPVSEVGRRNRSAKNVDNLQKGHSPGSSIRRSARLQRKK